MDNELVKRLMWSGLLAGVGALPSTIAANRIAAEILGKGVPGRSPRRLMAEHDASTLGHADGRGPKPFRVGRKPLPGSQDGNPFAERPELFVGAAFVGGLVLAQLLKRIGR